MVTNLIVDYKTTFESFHYSIFLFQNAFSTIQKINEFMGTNRGDELIHQIAAAIDIDKMRKGKASSMDGLGEKFGVVHFYNCPSIAGILYSLKCIYSLVYLRTFK